MSSRRLPALRLNHPSGESDFANAHPFSFFPIESYTYVIPPPSQEFALDFDDMVSQTLLQGPKGIRGLVSLVCKGDMMSYIIVVGEALEKMKKEYAIKDD